MTPRWRLVSNDQAILDLVDIFQNDEFTRIAGITHLQITSQVFYNNVVQSWSMISGEGVTDAQVLSGKIYWKEAQSGIGIYSVRWRPNALGFWRLVFTYAPVPQIITLDYDVQSRDAPPGGLVASFIK